MSIENNKGEKLFNEYLNFISSNEESGNFLRESGFDPDKLVNEGIIKIKQIKMKVEAEQTEKRYSEIQIKLFQLARQKVQELLKEVNFNLESFIKQENINLAYRNFENMNEKEITEFLERHFLLKLEKESNNKIDPNASK